MAKTIALPAGRGPDGLDSGSLLFVGTATTLLRYAGFTVLTDPNFLHRGEVAHLGWGLTSERLTDPAVELEMLPELDAVVLSHLHEDHFDLRVQRELARETRIVAPPEAARALEGQGFRRTEPLATWDSVTFTRGSRWLKVSAVPAQHGPRLLTRLLPETMGSVLDVGEGSARRLRVYVSGDTRAVAALEEIPRRFPDIDLALLHLGGTRVLGVLVTMDGAEGARALQIVDPRVAVPIHFDDYDRFRSPLEDFQRAVAEAGLAERVHYLLRGESLHFKVGAGARRLATETLPSPVP